MSLNIQLDLFASNKSRMNTEWAGTSYILMYLILIVCFFLRYLQVAGAGTTTERRAPVSQGPLPSQLFNEPMSIVATENAG